MKITHSNINSDTRLFDLVSWWLSAIHILLGHKLEAVIIGGSVAMGDFQPGWSDVDVCVVVVSSVTEQEGCRIGSIHDEMRVRFIECHQSGWCSGQAIEGHYVTRAMFNHPIEGLAYTAGGATRQLAVCSPINPFDRLIYSRYGIPLVGHTTLVEAPGPAALREQTIADVMHFFHPPAGCLESPIWLAGIMHWLARTVVFWRDGILLSKTGALEREIAANGPLSSFFELPLAIRLNGSSTAANHRPQLLSSYQACLPLAKTILDGLGIGLVE